MNDNALPTNYHWPVGFHSNPARFVISPQTWRAAGWSLALAVSFVPLLVALLLLLPWLPMFLNVTNSLAAMGARWMGAQVDPRRSKRWFDWPTFVNVILQILLSFCAFFITVGCLVTSAILLGIPFLMLRDPDPRFNLGSFVITDPSAIFPVSWLCSTVFFLLYLYLCWLVSGASVFSTYAANTQDREELARLEHSRVVLIDAFTGERSRIERELHDGVQQYLTAVKLNVATAELIATEKSPSGDIDPRLFNALKEANLNAHRALESLRSTVRGIFPQVLRDTGLTGALQELVAHSGIDSSITEEFSEDCDAQLSATSALLLYHCAAEGLTNAVRHGAATVVQIHVHFTNAYVDIFVDDNGQGFPQHANSGSGIGGLRERASALNGFVELSSSPNLPGARLHMNLPRKTGSQTSGMES